MSPWSEYRLIDILSQIDPALVEEEFPEGDIDNLNLFPEKKQNPRRKRIAILSGLAAGSIALTTVVMFVCKKHDVFKKAA